MVVGTFTLGRSNELAAEELRGVASIPYYHHFSLDR